MISVQKYIRNMLPERTGGGECVQRRVASRRYGALVIAAVAYLCAVAGCQDDSNAVVIEEPWGAPATLSADQKLYQGVEFQGGELTFADSIKFPGGTLTAKNNDYVYSISSGGLHKSPLTAGPQNQTEALTTLDANLKVVALSPTRVVQAGQVWVVPTPVTQRISYAGTGIRVDELAPDGQTSLQSYLLYDFSITPLAGAIANSPAELLAALPVSEWTSYGNFLVNASWQAGAEYIKRRGLRLADVVFAQDCANQYPAPPASTTTLPLACAMDATLGDSFFPISLLSSNDHPTETDFLSNGRIINWQGIPIWVAWRPLAREQSATENHRVFFELGGNIYMGMLQKHGTTFQYDQADGTRVPYQVVYNQAAVTSVRKGLVTGSVAGGSEDLNPPEVVPTIDLFRIGGHGIDGSLSPADLRIHYNVPSTLTGTGQTIAIVDAPATGPVLDDLNIFSDYFELPECNSANPCFQVNDLSNGAIPSAQNDVGSEVELDVQMVHALAPAAKIVLVIAHSNSHADLLSAVNTAEALPGVTAVSLSYTFSLATAETDSEDMKLASMQSNAGITLFSSSGDDGHLANATYPASSPYVTAVGGTRIRSVDWRLGAFSDVAWEFSGGGASAYAMMPAWQSAYVGPVVFAANGGMRAVPDVAAVADGQHSAVTIYYKGSWGLASGTSVATPIWAGIVALVGESLGRQGQSLATLVKQTPGGFNGLLYRAKMNAVSVAPFYDILSGSNNLTTSSCEVCTAAPGYNDITGLGVPNVASLLGLL